MNERIQELYKEATGKDWAYDFDTLVAEKFAELIVKECVKMVENEAAQYAEPVWAFELVNDMHKHFGVES